MGNLSKEDSKELTKERLFVALLKEKGFKYHELSGGESFEGKKIRL